MRGTINLEELKQKILNFIRLVRNKPDHIPLSESYMLMLERNLEKLELVVRQDKKDDDKIPASYESPISEWFELSYAQFLTVPRLALESMPMGWQQKMAALLHELDDTLDWRPKNGRWWVRFKDDQGRYSVPDHCDYRHGEIRRIKT
jgi:hypothetical protein